MLGPLRSREEEEVEGMKERVAGMLFAADRRMSDGGSVKLCLCCLLEEAAETQEANSIVKTALDQNTHFTEKSVC